MWKLKQLSARDVCSFREVEYAPAQGVTTLIFGHNADNENQQSNGSGKSTLLEAIALGITGSPLRKVRSEEIINDAAQSCRVQLCLQNDTTDETLHIDRTLSRKGASEVVCSLTYNEHTEQVVQPSVDAYNRYILDMLGISRDELFSSFILSRHRYSDFLSTSDREKKEIINRFSNGILVDQAIERLGQDVAPVETQLRDLELEFAGLEGRIGILSEQIAAEEACREQKQRSQKEKVASLHYAMAEKRNSIREREQSIARHEELKRAISRVDKGLQAMEDSPEPLEPCIAQVRELIAPYVTGTMTDWTKTVQGKKEDIALAQQELEKWTVILGRTSGKIVTVEHEHKELLAQAEAFGTEYARSRGALTTELEQLGSRLAAAQAITSELRERKVALSGAVERLRSQLAGKVECPACGHAFLVSDKAFDLKAAQQRLESRQEDMKNLDQGLLDQGLEAQKVEMMQVAVRDETRALISRKEQWDDRLSKSERTVQSAHYELEGHKFNLSRVQELLSARSEQIAKIRESLFAEAYELIDAAERAAGRSIAQEQEQIRAARSSITTLEQMIAEIEQTSAQQLVDTLRTTLRSCRKESEDLLLRKRDVQQRRDALIRQEQVFLQFKSFLANTKIEALSSVMNRVLVDLGSDLRVNLTGYTTLKTGAVREKISVTIIRDGVDAGSFGKFSEGEKARVNLASIVAMQRLVNSNCEAGKGLDMILIDEVIDAMDADGLSSVFSALNKLHITALVVSHGAVAESYRHRLLITKRDGESRLEG